MNRRQFLRMTGTGLVATATMAEAGMLAEFLDWLKRKPVWFFPSPAMDPYAEINRVTMKYIAPVLADNVFGPSYLLPMLQHVEQQMDEQSGKVDLATLRMPVPGWIRIDKPRMSFKLTGIS